MFSSTLHALRLRLRSSMFDALFAPRKPRHPLLRLALGLLGLALLAVGLVARVLRQRGQPAPRQDVLDGEFRIVDKPLLR